MVFFSVVLVCMSNSVLSMVCSLSRSLFVVFSGFSLILLSVYCPSFRVHPFEPYNISRVNNLSCVNIMSGFNIISRLCV